MFEEDIFDKPALGKYSAYSNEIIGSANEGILQDESGAFDGIGEA